MTQAADAERDWTFRDAGQLPIPLRALNSVGRYVRPLRALNPERIIDKAVASTELDDFAGMAWREGMDVLCEAVNNEAGVTPLGMLTQATLMQNLLEERLRLADYVRQHPTVREEAITQPIIVLGLPRTGTTLLSYLLDLDPQTRSLLSWESMQITPPSTLVGRSTDPRIARTDKQEARMAKLIPPAPAMHPLGACQPTECIPLLMMDFRSLGFETQCLVPSYGSWLNQCDMQSAYALHKQVLQTLQSTIPTRRWALKTPQHLWSLDALLQQYPDAKLVWTHRDPVSVVPSVSSLNMSFYRTFSKQTDPLAAAEYWMDKLDFAVSAGMRFDDQAASSSWCHHLQYQDLMRDPVESVRRLYRDHLGEELDPLHEQRMRVWMKTRPQHAHGRHVYFLQDFGLSAAAISDRFSAYTARFGIPAAEA